jgi:hypothetical protein
MGVVDASYDHPLKLEEQASAPLAGGVMMHGYQCGMLWGAALAAGAQAYRLYGAGPKAESAAIIASQRLVDTFRTRTRGEINCFEVTEMNWRETNQILPILKFFVKGGPIGCFRMAAGYAPEAFRDIEASLSEDPTEVPSSPVSCASVLAQKMGLSEMHTAMAAGLAGGIGLSGGGCGALGAAIWIIFMNSKEVEFEGFGFDNPRASVAIDVFVESSDYEFECSEIVGRRFENVSDHAEHIRNGGCSKIIETLANYL